MTGIPRIVLAGGRASPEMEAATGQQNRALATFQGKTLLQCVADALASADPGSQIVVVGDVPESPLYRRVSDAGDFVSNVFAGLKAVSAASLALIVTSDLPFLTERVVSDFLDTAAPFAAQACADIVYPVVPVAACYARYPGIHRTSVRLREGRFTGGNMMLVRPEFVLARHNRVVELYAARKYPVRLAAMLGMDTVLRMLAAQTGLSQALSVGQVERAASRLFQGTARALICDAPELATDLDSPSDFAALSKLV